MFILLPDIRLDFLTVINVCRLTDHVNDNTKLPILIFPEGGFHLIWIVSPSVDALSISNISTNYLTLALSLTISLTLTFTLWCSNQ